MCPLFTFTSSNHTKSKCAFKFKGALHKRFHFSLRKNAPEALQHRDLCILSGAGTATLWQWTDKTSATVPLKVESM